MGVFWQKESFKFVIKFSEANDQLSDYVCYCDSRLNAASIVTDADFSFTSSQSSTAALFRMQPASLGLTIMDAYGTLDRGNTASPYYGYMDAGIKILAYIADYVADTANYVWEPYGTWYVSSWENGFENGGITAVTIDCDDIISEISAISLTDTAYSGATAHDALVVALTAAGLTSSDYTIDNTLDLGFAYTKLKDNVALTINDILTLSMGYCSVKHNGKIQFISLNNVASTADKYDTGAMLGALTSTIASGINYGRVIVRYPNGSNSQLFQTATDYITLISNGENVIKLDMPEGLLSIEALRTILRGCTDSESITDVSYVLAGTVLTITITAELEASREVVIGVYATVPTDTAYNEEIVNINAVASNKSYAYEFTAPYTADATEAEAIANSLKDVLNRMKTEVSCGTSMLSPRINVGDTIVISSMSAEYDGSYAIVAMNINMGSSYNTSIRLLKYAEED